MTENDRSISVVIACYRDAGSVREMHRRLTEVLTSLRLPYEIIFVNDASPDNAEELLNAIAQNDPRVVVVNHTRNFGSQNAFLSGMAVSRGSGVVLMDGDLQDPPRLIPALVDKWEEGFDIVYGVRVSRKESLFRRVAYKAFYRIFRNLASINVPLDAGDFGLMDRKAVNILLNEFPEHLVFLRGLRAYTGLKHTGVEYIRDERFDGRSTNSFIGNLRWAKLAIFSFSYKPLEYISVLAFVMVCVTLAGTAFYLTIYALSYFYPIEPPPQGFMTQTMLVLLLSSIQLMCLSVLAEYLAHIYEEVKSRPRYVVRSIVDHRPNPAPADERPYR